MNSPAPALLSGRSEQAVLAVHSAIADAFLFLFFNEAFFNQLREPGFGLWFGHVQEFGEFGYVASFRFAVFKLSS